MAEPQDTIAALADISYRGHDTGLGLARLFVERMIARGWVSPDALAEHDREVRAPLQELIEEARETLTASSVPLGSTEAQFYRDLVHLTHGILSRDVSDDSHPGGVGGD